MAGGEPPPPWGATGLLPVPRGIGSRMFPTSPRIVLAGDGGERRPRSGIQSYPLDGIRLIRLERGSGASGRVVVWSSTGQEAASMFFEGRSLERAGELVALGRVHVARRRRAAGRRPDRPPQTS